nr:uncharacterized protein LOC107377347 [Nothobranchius furzeri]
MSTMFGNVALNFRLFVVICAAAVLLVSCSHSAKATSPTIATGYIRIKNNFLARLNAPYSQQPSVLSGLPSKEGDVRKATDTRWKSRGTPSIINHQHHPLPYTQGSFSFGQNSQDATRPRVRIAKVPSGGVKPESNVFTRSLQHGGNGFSGRPSRKQAHFFPLKEEKVGNPLNSNYLSQKRDHKYSKDSKRELDIPTRHLVLPQTRRLHSTPIKRYSDYKKTNQLPAVRVQSGSTGRNQVLGFRSHSAPPEASVARRNPSLGQLPSVPDLSHNQNSVSNKEVLGFKNVLSYPLKESPTQSNKVIGDGLEDGQMDAARYEPNPFGKKGKSTFGSNLKRPTRINPAIQNSISQKQSFTRHPIKLYPSQRDAAPPKDAPAEARNSEGFVPTVRLNSKDSAPSKTFAPLDRFKSASRKPAQSHKPEQPIRRISHLRGFTDAVKQPGKEAPVSERSQQSSLDKGMNNLFRFANPHFSLKYSFGPRGVFASAPASEKPQRLESTSPSPSVLASSTPGPLAMWLNRTELPKSVSKVGVNRNNTQTRFSLYKGRFGLKGFGIQPLEGAKVLPQGPDVSTKPDFKGFKLRSSHTWSPKRIRIQRRYNQAGETQPGTNSSGGVSKPRTKISKGDGSVPRSSSNEVTNKIQIFQILRPDKDGSGLVQNKTSWRHSDHRPGVASSSYLRSAGNPKAAPKPESEPKEAKKHQLIPDQRIEFQSATSSIVRGTRVKLSNSRKLHRFIVINSTRNSPIIRQPRVKAVTYADIVGSASFSSIQAKSFPPADRDFFPNMTRTKQDEGPTLEFNDGRNTSGSLQEDSENDLDDLKSIEKNNFGKIEETDNEIKISDLFFDSEGSGSGDFNLSNVLSTSKESQAAERDLLELDYLRKSTENIFFKSVRCPGVDQR